MSPEATIAPTDHLATSFAEKKALAYRLYDLGAFSAESAVTVASLDLFGAEKFALDELIKQGIIITFEKESEQFIHLHDRYTPQKNYRKKVVMGLSIPILFFMLFLFIIGVVAIVISIVYNLL
jgi:hypothetical protein